MNRVSFDMHTCGVHCVKTASNNRPERICRGDKNRIPLEIEILLKNAKNSFTVVIFDKGFCNVSAVRFHQEKIFGESEKCLSRKLKLGFPFEKAEMTSQQSCLETSSGKG